MILLFDTSALVAHWRGEKGADNVQKLLEMEDTEMYISALTVGELWRVFERFLKGGDIGEALMSYVQLFDDVIDVSFEIAIRAGAVTERAKKRIPYTDALIAATALELDADLVYADAHFDSLQPDKPGRMRIR